MNCVMRAGGEAVAAAETAFGIDGGTFTTKTIFAFRHQGQRMNGAGSDTATTTGAGRRDPEKSVLFFRHATLKNQGGLRRIFR
jgi:hypothetical protein